MFWDCAYFLTYLIKKIDCAKSSQFLVLQSAGYSFHKLDETEIDENALYHLLWMCFYEGCMRHCISRIKRLCEGYTMTKRVHCIAQANLSSPSDHVKSCAYAPAHQYWKATVKWKFQNQRNGISTIEGGLLSGSLFKSQKELFAQICAWKLMETSSNSFRASDKFSVL